MLKGDQKPRSTVASLVLGMAGSLGSGAHLEAEFMGADWDPEVTQGLWDWTALGYAKSVGSWETAESLGSQELPNVPVVTEAMGACRY